MAIVWSCDLDVQRYAALGKSVQVPRPCCPICAAWMIFWSGYFRPVRCQTDVQIWVRRARCVACARSDALLPSFLLLKRLDPVEVIGEAIASIAQGVGARRVANSLGLYRSTVRSWWSRHCERAQFAITLTMALVGLGVRRSLTVSPALAALQVLVPTHQHEPRPDGVWREASLHTGGLWLVPCHHHHLVSSQARREGV